MARVILQAGHCHRKTGSIGTRAASGFTEQQFTWAVANRARDLLASDGHDATVILADPPSSAYRGEAFVAIHADGNNNPGVRGASVGFRSPEGKQLAHAWKNAYRNLGWPSGFRGDNYTAALAGYYGNTRAISQGNRHACIIEAGFLTNPTEASILTSAAGQERCAEAIRRAVAATFGTPAPIPQEDDMEPRAFIKTEFGTWLRRLPQSEEEMANHLAYLAFHGQEATVDNLAGSDEAKAKR